MDLVVLAPVYNDWESLACLMGELAGVFLPYSFCSSFFGETS